MYQTYLFEDDKSHRKDIVGHLIKRIGSEVEIACFDPDDGPEHATTYEQHIERRLRERNSVSPIGLIACDKELGRYSNYPGLSAHAVSIAARNLGIPFCQYSQRLLEKEFDRYKALQRWHSEDITLPGNCGQEWAREIAILFKGFNRIRESYGGTELNRFDPSMALAAIMGRKSAASRIALYGSGDQRFMTEVLAFINIDDTDNRARIAQRMPRVLGTWLYLSLLRFPGLLVNEIAASSYLNIEQCAFKRSAVQEYFDVAVYQGPFCELKRCWWRDGIDDLLADSGASDGKEYLKSFGINVNGCRDADTDDRAGYYCMITQEAVSLSNSTGNLNWFPAGADLARIRSSKFEQITSLVEA